MLVVADRPRGDFYRKRVFSGLGSEPEMLSLDGGLYRYPDDLSAAGINPDLVEWGRVPDTAKAKLVADRFEHHDVLLTLLPPTDGGDALEFDIAKSVLSVHPHKAMEVFRAVPSGCDSDSLKSALSTAQPISLTAHAGSSARRIVDRLLHAHSRRTGRFSSRTITPVLAALVSPAPPGRLAGVVHDPDGAAPWRFSLRLPSGRFDDLRRSPMDIVPSLLSAIVEGATSLMEPEHQVPDYFTALLMAAEAVGTNCSQFIPANQLLADLYVAGKISWPWTSGEGLSPAAGRALVKIASQAVGRPVAEAPFVDYRSERNPRLLGVLPTARGLQDVSLNTSPEHLTPSQALMKSLTWASISAAADTMQETRIVAEGPIAGAVLRRPRRPRIPGLDGDRHTPPQLSFAYHDDALVVAETACACLRGDLIAVPGVVRKIIECGLFADGALTKAGAQLVDQALPELTDPFIDHLWRKATESETSAESAVGTILSTLTPQSRISLFSEFSASPIGTHHA